MLFPISLTKFAGDLKDPLVENLKQINEGEEVGVKLESSMNQTLIVSGKVKNNEAVIMNVLKENQ